MTMRRCVGVVWAVLMIAGCSGGTGGGPGGGNDGGSGSVTDGGSPTTCASGQTSCGGTCVTVATDASNCGTCGNACASTEACVSGTCQRQCATGLVACGAACVDPSTSMDHCGASGDCQGVGAGTACGGGYYCGGGVCRLQCSGGEIDCGGVCTNPATSANHCGASGDCQGANAGATCTASETCLSGSCQGTDATLSSLFLSAGSLSPVFNPATLDYAVAVSNAYDSFQVTPTTTDPKATLTVDGTALASGSTSAAVPLVTATPRTLTIVVTAPAGNTATYTVTVTRRYPAGVTASSGADRGDGFGYSVAISGDTLVVGAPYEDSAATTIDGNEKDNSAGAAGAAYVFTRDGKGTWRQQAYLKPSNNRAGAQFGSSVAIDKDMVVVGAPYESSAATGVGGNGADTSAAGAGAAYVFVRDSLGNWSQQAYLKASNTDAGDNFGHAVAVSQGTVAVSAILEASAAAGIDGDQTSNVDPGAGAVYLFHQSPKGAWSQVAYVKASNTNPHDSFGTSVALDGSILAVGAQAENSNATGVNGDQTNNAALHAGAVYVFGRSLTGVWAQQAYLKASNTGSPDLFGRSVTVSGTTVVVGAAGEASNATGVDGDQTNNAASDAGAAYVFTRDAAGTWKQQAYLKASNTDAGDIFGQAVSLDHDTLLVGALQEASSAPGVNGDQTDNSVPKAGAAYLFTRDAAGHWTQRAYLKALAPAASDFFGRTVGVSGDMLVVGADETPRTASGIGVIYLF